LSEISGGVIVGGVVPQDVEVTSPEKSSNDESHDEKFGDGNINDDLNIDSPEEMEDGDVVVVGTIPFPTREKVNEKQREQPIVYFRRRFKKQGSNQDLNKLKLQSHIPLQTPLQPARKSRWVIFFSPLSM